MEHIVSPSILSADFAHLQDEVDTIRSAAWLHCDVMDGQFVPNLTFGAPLIKDIHSDHIKDVHVMIQTPWKLLDDFIEAGADFYTFHIEACDNEFTAKRVIEIIHERGIKAGITLRPRTHVSEIASVLDLLDLVLVMSVEPGFGGQSFIPESLGKVEFVREKRPDMHISIDGGINAETGKMAREAGANILVAGSYIFGADDREAAIQSLS